MVYRALVVAMILAVTCMPALADVACVQRELARIGLDPGSANGQQNKKTLRAARIYLQGAPYLEDTSDIGSRFWCELLELQPRLAAFAQGQIALDSAAAGATSHDAIGVTPIFGLSADYQVPEWVNNPPGRKKK